MGYLKIDYNVLKGIGTLPCGPLCRALYGDNVVLVGEMILSEQIEELQIQMWRRDFIGMTLTTSKTIRPGFVMLVWWEVE